MRLANRSPLTPDSLAADGMQGAGKAEIYCTAQHSSQGCAEPFLARVAIDAAQAQLGAYALATDGPQPGTVEARNPLDAAGVFGRRKRQGWRVTAPLTGNRCQCPTCSNYFGSVRGFDRHRLGAVGAGRRCMTEAEMRAAGWHRSARGFLLTPDPRRAGANVLGPRVYPAAIGVQEVMR